jgi:hypothetical protein
VAIASTSEALASQGTVELVRFVLFDEQTLAAFDSAMP